MGERGRLWLLLAPYLFGLAVLVALPAGATFALAVTEWDLIGTPRFVGFDNFRGLWEDPIFERALRNSLHFAAIGVPLRLLAALGLALLLHRRFRGVVGLRSAAVVPTVVPEIEDALEPILEGGLYRGVPPERVAAEARAASEPLFARARR